MDAPPTPLRAARSAAFTLYFYAMSTLLAIAALPYSLSSSGVERARRVAWLWERATHFGLRWIVGLEVEIEGRERLPEGACVIAAKHQSELETLTFHLTIDRLAVALKAELMAIPLFGVHLRKAGNISIDRGGAAVALRSLLKGAKAAIARGDRVMIYPEGTRRPVGAPPDYKPGVTALYAKLGVPVVPVALDTGLYWRKGWFGKRPGRARMAFLEPIAPGLDRKTFEARLISAIESRTDALIERARTEEASR